MVLKMLPLLVGQNNNKGYNQNAKGIIRRNRNRYKKVRMEKGCAWIARARTSDIAGSSFLGGAVRAARSQKRLQLPRVLRGQTRNVDTASSRVDE